MNKRHFITGATGLVGSLITLEILQKTRDSITCLVRAKQGESSQHRLLKTLHSLVDLYALPSLLHQEIDHRCYAVDGDLTQDLLDVAKIIEAPVHYMWHAAASLDYEERFAKEIHAINVGGTKAALALAKELKVEFFNHISTAYVAGRNVGVIQEKLTEPECPNNTYEASKILGEKLVRSTTGMTTRIFRPSIVIGHSKTLGALTFSGLYGFVRRTVQFNAVMNRVKDGYLNSNRLKMIIDENVPINFIPVDLVAKEVVEIGLSEAPSNIFHICNTDVSSVRECVDAVFDALGVQPPIYTKCESEYSDIDAKFNEKIEFYASYLRGLKLFCRKNTLEILGKRDDKQFEVDKPCLTQHVHWYLGKLKEKRSQIPIMR